MNDQVMEDEISYTCKKGFLHNTCFDIIDHDNEKATTLRMFLIKTGKSKRYGFEQPKSYIDINPKENFSEIRTIP